MSDLVKVNVLRASAYAEPVLKKDGTPSIRTVDLGGYSREEELYKSYYVFPGEQMLPQAHAEVLVANGHAAWPVTITPQVPDSVKGAKKIAADPLS